MEFSGDLSAIQPRPTACYDMMARHGAVHAACARGAPQPHRPELTTASALGQVHQ